MVKDTRDMYFGMRSSLEWLLAHLRGRRANPRPDGL
jgi:hypothetical protein